MAIRTGYKRSLSVSVSKTVGGSPVSGYPKTYPTAQDVTNGYFVYNTIQYPIPTSTQLSEMSELDYNILVANFKLYVMSIEGGDIDTDSINDNLQYDPSTCVPGIV